MTATPGAQAVDRAAGLLRHVVEAAGPVSFTDLMTGAALPRSTTSRLMLALENNDLVRRNQAGRYLPGPLLKGITP